MTVKNYIELMPDEIVRDGDCRISCTFDLIPMPQLWIGKSVADLAPIKVGRPRSVLINDALLRVRSDLIAEFGALRYKTNFQYIDDALGDIQYGVKLSTSSGVVVVSNSRWCDWNAAAKYGEDEVSADRAIGFWVFTD